VSQIKRSRILEIDDLESLCNKRCEHSTSLVCTCRCRGENHGAEVMHRNHAVTWKERKPANRKPTLRQEARAGQLFMFDINPRRRRAAHKRGATGADRGAEA
jgi:hypothetical protein